MKRAVQVKIQVNFVYKNSHRHGLWLLLYTESGAMAVINAPPRLHLTT